MRENLRKPQFLFLVCDWRALFLRPTASYSLRARFGASSCPQRITPDVRQQLG